MGWEGQALSGGSSGCLALEKVVEVLRVRARGVDSVQQGATADQKAESCWSVPLPCLRAHRSLSS